MVDTGMVPYVLSDSVGTDCIIFQHETILFYFLLPYPPFNEIFVPIYRYLIAIKTWLTSHLSQVK
jgi:hypothetical protein